MARNVKPNLVLLINALQQAGPWSGQKIVITDKWLREQLHKHILEINWPQTCDDVKRFIPQNTISSLKEWRAEYFIYLADRLII